MSRNYHAEILDATMAGDIQKVAAIALELAQRDAVATALEQREAERKAKRAQQKQTERTRRATSRDMERQEATSPLGSSPLVPPPPLPAPNPSTPLNPPASLAPTARRSVRPPVTDSRRASWLEPSCTSWEAKFGAGSFPWPEAGRVLKRLHSAGHEPEEIATRLARYLAKTETRYVSLARFAKTFDDWKEFRFLEGPPVVDGWMSPELERLTRPAGVYAA